MMPVSMFLLLRSQNSGFLCHSCMKMGLFGVDILCSGFSCTAVEVFQVIYTTVHFSY